MNRLLVIFILLISAVSFSQTDVNQKDSQGRKQGKWKQAYKDVKAYRYVGQFKDDIPVGKFVYYFENGNVQAVVHFFNKGTVTRSKMYHDSGYMMAQGKYINQKKDSLWVYYDDRGYLSYQETFKGGKKNGQSVYFYAPRDGKYYVSRYEYYKNDVLHGEFKEYHENSKLKAKGQYRDGNLHGTVTHYYQNGKIKKVLKYKYAVEHGPWVFYDKKATQIGIKWYWEGVLAETPEAEQKFKALWDKSKTK
jgi:antitoxin component YwqK of YwqJK toxin-antitoxin module